MARISWLIISSALLICACSKPAQTLTDEQKLQGAKRAFAALDLNHDGVITRQEWTVSAIRAGAGIPRENRPQYVRDSIRIFLQHDKNEDGKVTFSEYIANNFGEGAG